ncbi:hypothetical protein EDC35_101449 [Thiobaca trueperi]|uniref:Uncharacterized protein n=1 Tax=Thiobaca trueperi TaxID=127458 RepID=A0A4R3NAS9_9GAMM|nr:hypothetical protein EDC35_101449 [Thiobaca trueperi]
MLRNLDRINRIKNKVLTSFIRPVKPRLVRYVMFGDWFGLGRIDDGWCWRGLNHSINYDFKPRLHLRLLTSTELNTN